MVRSYAECLEMWGTRKRKLTHNTYLECCENGPQGPDGDPFCFYVRLHATRIVKFNRPKEENGTIGSIELDSGGWQTVTTKSRMNDCLSYGWGIHQTQGIWYLSQGYGDDSTLYPYADGITIAPDGTVAGEGSDPRAALKLRKRIKKYARDYVAAFGRGEVPAPSGGDCWACCMKATDGNYPMGDKDKADPNGHWVSHLDESYFVPSILSRAVERFPVSQFAQHCIAVAWAPDSEAQGYDPKRPFGDISGIGGVGFDQIRKSIQRFMYEQTGSAS